MRKAVLIVLILITLVVGFRLTERIIHPFQNMSGENMYPTNDAGLTYGPNIKENVDPEKECQLILYTSVPEARLRTSYI